MPARLDAVLTVIYLVFNEGYAATRGAPLVRTDLCAEAIRLGRLVRDVDSRRPPAEATAPPRADAAARFAARRAAGRRRRSRRCSKSRIAAAGIARRSPKRCRWSTEALARRARSLRAAGGDRRAALPGGPAEDTDWPQIVRLYDLLERLQPSPIVALNRARRGRDGRRARSRASASSTRSPPRRSGRLPPAACRARRPAAPDGAAAEAASSYRAALELVSNDSERRFLERRLGELE